MATRDAQGHATHEHARAGNLALVDGVAQSNVRESPSTKVSDGREAGQQRTLRTRGSSQRLPRFADAQNLVAEAARPECEMHMGIDQSGQDAGIREVDER